MQDDGAPTTPPSTRASWLAWASVGLLPVAAVAQALGRPVNPQDDAFISFRYAANLLQGHGLVYNPGEWVEGYTNLLWTLLMASAMALGVDPVHAAAGLGAACFGALVIVAAVLGARAGAERGHALVGATVAGALVATDLQGGLEAVQGLETTFYALLVTAGAALAVREAERGGALRHLGSTALFAAAVLTRPEAPLQAALVHLGLLATARDRRAQLVASLASGAGVALALGALTGWRLSTYGYPLPNTFYAKAGGVAFARGVRYLAAHALDHPALWGLALARGIAGRPTRWTLPLAALVVGHLGYVTAVGGDFKPTGRFVLPVEAAMAVLAAETVVRLAAAAAPGLRWGGLAGIGAALIGGTVRLEPGVAFQAEERHADFMARRAVGEFLRRSFPPDTLVAIHSAGAVPYYSRLPTIDMWGLTDAHIARAPVPEFGTGLAGHERSDPVYVFGRDPALYLPEDHLLTLQPQALAPGPGFPDDFEDRYRNIILEVDGLALNVWVRRGFIDSLNPGGR